MFIFIFFKIYIYNTSSTKLLLMKSSVSYDSVRNFFINYFINFFWIMANLFIVIKNIYHQPIFFGELFFTQLILIEVVNIY